MILYFLVYFRISIIVLLWVLGEYFSRYVVNIFAHKPCFQSGLWTSGLSRWSLLVYDKHGGMTFVFVSVTANTQSTKKNILTIWQNKCDDFRFSHLKQLINKKKINEQIIWYFKRHICNSDNLKRTDKQQSKGDKCVCTNDCQALRWYRPCMKTSRAPAVEMSTKYSS